MISSAGTKRGRLLALVLVGVAGWAGSAGAIDLGGGDEVASQHAAFEACKVLGSVFDSLNATFKKLPKSHLGRRDAYAKVQEDPAFAKAFPLQHRDAGGQMGWRLHEELKGFFEGDAQLLESLMPGWPTGQAIQKGLRRIAAYEKVDHPGGESMNPFGAAVKEVRALIRAVAGAIKKGRKEILCGQGAGRGASKEPEGEPDSLLGVPLR